VGSLHAEANMFSNHSNSCNPSKPTIQRENICTRLAKPLVCHARSLRSQPKATHPRVNTLRSDVLPQAPSPLRRDESVRPCTKIDRYRMALHQRGGLTARRSCGPRALSRRCRSRTAWLCLIATQGKTRLRDWSRRLKAKGERDKKAGCCLSSGLGRVNEGRCEGRLQVEQRWLAGQE
jgi:hypothetical protein